jgi:UDP-N-acetylmuramyl pentapeptide synthase
MGNVRRLSTQAWRRGKARIGGLVLAAMSRHRRSLSGVTFVGVTGSCGKTTAKDLIGGVLASRFSGIANYRSGNSLRWILLTLLATRPSHRFCVQEIGASGPNSIGKSIQLVRPAVAVVTNVGADHCKAFRSLEATAAEKAKLVVAVPASGTAILNADDPHVLAMREKCAGRVLTYGLSETADLRAVDVRSAWPGRLSFTVVHAGERVPLVTQLCGEHWTPCVLAALGVGLAFGIPLSQGARALARVEPRPGRMSPVEVDGVTFVRDDWKAPLWSIPPALAFLRSAAAARKIAVIGTLSDYAGSNEKRYAMVARESLGAVDHVIFAGRWARGALRAARAAAPGALQAFDTVEEAARWLRGFLRPGDLVLLKGSLTVDHLERVIHAWRRARLGSATAPGARPAEP